MCVSSLCISIKVILTTSVGIRREVFYFLESCLITSGNTERGNAQSLRCENKRGQEEIKMSEQKKKPETTIATLDMAKSGQLTLTTKHLRGQVLKVIQQPGGAKIRQMEQIDVLLSALGGYSVVDIKLRMMRIVMRIIGTVIGILGALLWASDLDFLSEIGMFPTLIGFAIIGVSFLVRDQVAMELNIMGGRFAVPLLPNQAEKAREFLNQLQQAKTEYEESVG